jgi:hypothetical protein
MLAVGKRVGEAVGTVDGLGMTTCVADSTGAAEGVLETAASVGAGVTYMI